MSDSVALDDPRVRAIAADVLGDQLAGLDPAGILVEMQVTAKFRALAAQHPDSEVELHLVDGEPGGYSVVERFDGVVRLCDIAVISAWRGRGIGAEMLRALIARADAAQEPIELSVWHAAPARGWYERHGFRVCGGDAAAHVEMRREPIG